MSLGSKPAAVAPATPIQVIRATPAGLKAYSDLVATEEPLEIRVTFEKSVGLRVTKTISLTMRTPGNDAELAVGFLFGEGILKSRADLESVPAAVQEVPSDNTINVGIRDGLALNFASLDRHFYTTSSCGVCGKTSLEALKVATSALAPAPEIRINRATLVGMPETLRQAQGLFEQTGGLHAAGLFDLAGRLLAVREDVGRHNAVDKLVGFQVLSQGLPFPGKILVLSGRVSFELMQKAIMAGIAVVVSVGAPSSLAVEVAREFGVTLVGFVRENRLNIYSAAQRIAEIQAPIH